MLSIKVKKLYRKCVSLRDDQVLRAVKADGAEVWYGNEKMTILPDQLSEGLNLTRTGFKSKFDGSFYWLVDFPWKPDKADAQADVPKVDAHIDGVYIYAS